VPSWIHASVTFDEAHSASERKYAREKEYCKLKEHCHGNGHDGLEIKIKCAEDGEQESDAKLVRLVHIGDGLHLVYQHLHLQQELVRSVNFGLPQLLTCGSVCEPRIDG
jgi:hypothetical protein